MNKSLSNLLTRINNLITFKEKTRPNNDSYEDALFSEEEMNLFDNFWIQKNLEEYEFKLDSRSQPTKIKKQ